MSLNEKYRPSLLKHVIGNTDTVTYLKKWKGKVHRKESVPHAYILIGETGCGKTTLARIISETLVGKDYATSFDYTELNSGEFRGIDTAREIARSAQLRPMQAPNRVFFLDEIHRATTDAQTALLKPVEEAAEHTYFLFATTEVSKVSRPLFNRCIPLYVSPLNKDETQTLIDKVLEGEGSQADYDLGAIQSITGGRPREIFQILEKVVDGAGELLYNLKYSEGENASGAEITLARELAKDKTSWKKLAEIAGGIQDAERARHILLQYHTKVLLGGNSTPLSYMVLESFREPSYTQTEFIRNLYAAWMCRKEI